GASFTAWTEADTADTGAEILDAGAGDTDVNANFIKGVLNADGKLHLGDNPDDENIIAETYVIRLNHEYGGVALRGDAEDGFVYATADVAADSTNRFFAGILHTTDLGAPITDSRGRALWKGVIQAFRYDGTNAYTHNADFVLRVDFDAETLAFDGANGVVTLLGAPTLRFSITTGTFDKTTGLITGEVLFEDNTQGSSKESTGILRGVIGREGAVGVFASPSTTGTFGDFVGGFVASSADKLPICVSLIEDPFGDNCLRTDSLVLAAQLAACSTGLLGSNTPVNPADCNDAALSGVICSDDITVGSDADPFSRICSDDAITIVSFSDGLTDLDGDTMIDLDDVRQKVRTYCDVTDNSQQTVCIARRAQIDALSGRCIAANEPNLFGDICSSYREFGAARALLCRNRADTTSTTHNTYNCDTKDIIAHLCAGNGAAANPFDEEICGTDGTHAGARQGFAARCAQDLANDPTATGNLNGAVCLGSGLNTPCLIDPFSTGVIGDSTCKEHADYDAVREDRKIFCRGSEAVKYKEGNIFDYECRSAVVDVCGSASAPKDVDLFSDRLLCAGEGYDTRRAAIVRDCAAAAVNNPEDANCQFEIVGAVTRLVNMTDAITGVTTQVPEIVTPAKKVGDCIIDPYDVECAHAAFGNQRTAVLGGCETAFTGAGCLKVQENVCGGGIYAGDPFDAFCDKKDTADPTLTIAPETLADGRNKYCQIGT
ncbi:MAG: hypothetical protein K8953_02140, partial [Proteobacteria bacterium]|nr:hypothetical protein [Pseudomonadota bacterium]